jgi:transcriptional regulator with XRE-family HTH domain
VVLRELWRYDGGVSKGPTHETFPAMLRRLRERAGHKQRTLARLVNVNPTLISYYETGRRKPSGKRAEELADGLKLTGGDREAFLAPTAPVDPSGVIRRLTKLLSGDFSEGAKILLAGGVNTTIERWKRLEEKRISWGVVPAAGWQAELLATEKTATLVRKAVAEGNDCGLRRYVVVIAPTQQKGMREKFGHNSQYRLAVQGERRGLGHAIETALRSLPPNEPFALMLPDDSVDPSCLKALLQEYQVSHSSLVAFRALRKGDRESHGVVTIGARLGNVWMIKSVEEKPAKSQGGQSAGALLGRYVLTPEVGEALKEAPEDERSGRIELAGALDRLAKRARVFGYKYNGKVDSIHGASVVGSVEAFLRGRPQPHSRK